MIPYSSVIPCSWYTTMLGKKSSLAPVLACLRDNGVGLCNIFRITHVCITSIMFFCAVIIITNMVMVMIMIINDDDDDDDHNVDEDDSD